MRREFIIGSLLIIIAGVLLGLYVSSVFWWILGFFSIFILIGIRDMFQTRHAITRNFPLMGHGRFIADWLHPKIYQYFVEPDTDGRPFSRILRSVIYQRAKGQIDTEPFGTQLNVYDVGYEWLNHSIAALDHHELDPDPRVLIGGPDCKQPYACSLFNISAMSYGSLSKNAVLAMNGGAAKGGFAHNTGEGGISPYHLKPGGDLIYQIGTGYFGCRNAEGGFDPDLYRQRTASEQVKMIELKLSQGAKPGHGGILPSKKVSEEIAEIRNVPVGEDVHSPPYHKAFDTPVGLLEFIQQLRDLSDGKPIGFKMCIGHKAEFLSICKAMVQTGIMPDFISIDGGEGGTGAAPLEFSNAVGMPFKEGLSFAYNALEGFGIKEHIKLFGAGKIINGFNIFRAMALGADACYSARAMMMAVGCIQALECNTNTCPTGVATQDKELMRGLVVADKTQRVANYHRQTMFSFNELLAATGLNDPDKINRSHIYRRTGQHQVMRFDQIYPYIPKGSLLQESTIPETLQFDMSLASVEKFMRQQPLEKLHL